MYDSKQISWPTAYFKSVIQNSNNVPLAAFHPNENMTIYKIYIFPSTVNLDYNRSSSYNQSPVKLRFIITLQLILLNLCFFRFYCRRTWKDTFCTSEDHILLITLFSFKNSVMFNCFFDLDNRLYMPSSTEIRLNCNSSREPHVS
jgi:hypothetical protein